MKPQGDTERSGPPSTSALNSQVYENHPEYMQNNFMISNSQKNVKIIKTHQKKPSAGTTLSKGQKQLRQILNN